MIEWPAVDHRLLLWQNGEFRVTGFLDWNLLTWRDNLPGDQRWPAIRRVCEWPAPNGLR